MSQGKNAPSAGFAIRSNRPHAQAISPIKLAVAVALLVAVVVAGFAIRNIAGSTQSAMPDDDKGRSANRTSSRRFDFEDAPKSYGELAPVALFKPPEVSSEPQPQIVIKEVVREVPVPVMPAGPVAPIEDPAEQKARHSSVTFSAIAEASTGAARTFLGPRVLPAGHRLRAVLDTAIHSETPGLVKATILSDPRGLIPTGAKLVGNYDGSQIRFTGSRLAVSFSELQFGHNAIAITAHAADAEGRAGLPGDVDRHVGALIGLSALNVVSGAAIGSTARRGDDFEAALAGESIREGARLTRDTGRQVLEVAPTIEIRAGTGFDVVLIEALRL